MPLPPVEYFWIRRPPPTGNRPALYSPSVRTRDGPTEFDESRLLRNASSPGAGRGRTNPLFRRRAHRRPEHC